MKNLFLFFLMLLIPIACSSQSKSVDSYESCVKAGNPILKMYPPKCVDQVSKKTYVEGSGKNLLGEDAAQASPSICKDLCGNGTCEQMVCQGEGCPCAETPQQCAADCALQF